MLRTPRARLRALGSAARLCSPRSSRARRSRCFPWPRFLPAPVAGEPRPRPRGAPLGGPRPRARAGARGLVVPARAIVYGSATGTTTPITGGAGAAAAPDAVAVQPPRLGERMDRRDLPHLLVPLPAAVGPGSVVRQVRPLWIGAVGALGLVRLAWRRAARCCAPRACWCGSCSSWSPPRSSSTCPSSSSTCPARRRPRLLRQRRPLPAPRLRGGGSGLRGGLCELVRRDAWPLVSPRSGRSGSPSGSGST